MSKTHVPGIVTIGLLLALLSWFGVIGLDTQAGSEAQMEPASSATSGVNPGMQPAAPAAISNAAPPTAVPTAAARIAPTTTLKPLPTAIPTTAPTAAPKPLPTLAPESWKEWPVMPAVSAELRQLFQRSVAQGSINPNAFSVFGDCQSEAEGFLGVFDSSPGLVAQMAPDLRETAAQFQGSFLRYNPAAKSGSSAGSLLFAPWNDNKEGLCRPGETPADCELRVYRPGIVFIHLGTHYEARERNYSYLSILIEKVLKTGAVPVLVTKADNLEGDERVNQNYALLAVKYNLPLWNFWASVQSLPEQGLQADGMLLTKDGSTVHQLDALRVLGLVWRAVR